MLPLLVALRGAAEGGRLGQAAADPAQLLCRLQLPSLAKYVARRSSCSMQMGRQAGFGQQPNSQQGPSGAPAPSTSQNEARPASPAYLGHLLGNECVYHKVFQCKVGVQRPAAQQARDLNGAVMLPCLLG